MPSVRYLPRSEGWAVVTEGRAVVSVPVETGGVRSLFPEREQLLVALRRQGLYVDARGRVSASEGERSRGARELGALER